MGSDYEKLFPMPIRDSLYRLQGGNACDVALLHRGNAVTQPEFPETNHFILKIIPVL